jgi:hypothetical protein
MVTLGYLNITVKWLNLDQITFQSSVELSMLNKTKEIEIAPGGGV